MIRLHTAASAVGAALCLLVTATAGCDRLVPAPEPPRNLIVITFDTLRAGHVGAYGYDRNTTPNLDAFASESVLFETAYSQAASTVPALSSLMTSRYPHQTGVLETYKYAVPDDEITLAERMKENGFDTAAILGIGVLMPTRRMDQGFDHYSYTLYTNKQYWKTAAEITDEAVEWLGESRERPFFLWLHYFEPHQPYDVVPVESRVRFLDVPSSHPMLEGVKPDSMQHTRIRHKIDAYDGALSHADSEFGRLMSEIRKLGLLDDSMIVVSADHGETLGEHGQHGHVFGLWEQVIRIPLVIRLPNVRPARVAGRVQHVDVVPTVVREMGLSTEDAPPFEGQALPLSRSDDRRFWVREKLEARDSFAETWYRNHRAASLVTERWKFILDQPHDGTEVKTWLFDLDADPLELMNLVGEEAAVAEALERRLRDWMNEDFHTPDVIGKKGGELEMLKALGYVD
jgi:arylsulfatase A-like enzyme